jgi:chloramphenicol-sensitive protein RarD
MSQKSGNRIGLIYGVAAYFIWGLFPLYWVHLKPAGAFEIVAHRAIWSLAFCLIVLAFKGEVAKTYQHLKNRATLIRLALSTSLISVNWLTYIWAVNHQRVVEAALGYYINPLVIITLGVVVLKERLRKLQYIALAFAAIGVIVLTIDYGQPPWIALTLALSWGSYGFIKKKLGLAAITGLTVETSLALIPALAYILLTPSHFAKAPHLTFLMILSGVVTAIPLLLFNGATNHLPLSLMGLLQYITPTVQFLIGVWVQHESMSPGRWVGFFFIWIALIWLSGDLIKENRN